MEQIQAATGYRNGPEGTAAGSRFGDGTEGGGAPRKSFHLPGDRLGRLCPGAMLTSDLLENPLIHGTPAVAHHLAAALRLRRQLFNQTTTLLERQNCLAHLIVGWAIFVSLPFFPVGQESL